MSSAPLIMCVAVDPTTSADQRKMELAMAKLASEELTFKFRTDQNSGQTIISDTDEVHLGIIVRRMMLEFDIEASFGKPQAIYLETIRAEAEAEGKYIRQMGGLGNYGHAKICVGPNERGAGYEFSNAIKGGVIPNQYITPIDQSIQQAMADGVLAGCEMVDIKVSLYDGSFHDTDSNEMAFKIAAALAFKEAARKARPVLLEPLMAVEITVPERYLGTLLRDLHSRRGLIERTDEIDGMQAIKATVPLSNMLGYATALRGITQTRASFSMKFKQYEVSPNRPDFGDDGAHIGAPVPKRPRPGSNRARADLSDDPES